jgi:hypothetical protein
MPQALALGLEGIFGIYIANPPWSQSQHTRDDRHYIRRILQQGIGTYYDHLALTSGKFHGERA